MKWILAIQQYNEPCMTLCMHDMNTCCSQFKWTFLTPRHLSFEWIAIGYHDIVTIPYSGKFSWGPIFADGQSSKFSRMRASMPIIHCTIVLFSRVWFSRIAAHPRKTRKLDPTKISRYTVIPHSHSIGIIIPQVDRSKTVIWLPDYLPQIL
jgi:hypothetical protein